MKKVSIFIAVVGIAAVTIWLLFVYIPDTNRRANVGQRFNFLSDEYLHPDFSPEFCYYWGVSDLVSYRAALKQQFDQESDDAMDAAYGHDVDQKLYFFHLRMNNWMEREMIFRAEWFYEFDNRGDKQKAAFSIDMQPPSVSPAPSK